MSGDVMPVEKYLATGGCEELCNQVKACAFASTVRTDDGMNRMPFHLEVHIIDSHEPQKFFGQSAGLDHEFC